MATAAEIFGGLMLACSAEPQQKVKFIFELFDR